MGYNLQSSLELNGIELRAKILSFRNSSALSRFLSILQSILGSIKSRYRKRASKTIWLKKGGLHSASQSFKAGVSWFFGARLDLSVLVRGFFLQRIPFCDHQTPRDNELFEWGAKFRPARPPARPAFGPPGLRPARPSARPITGPWPVGSSTPRTIGEQQRTLF